MYSLFVASCTADGINFHGGHHDVLIEKCELSYAGDDPIGLWPVSADAHADAQQCQQNIVVRNNVARWPRQYAGMEAGAKSPRDFTDCDCRGFPSCGSQGGCCSHPCFATYAGGSGVQWVNNHCEGAFNILSFNGDYPDPKKTWWCGPQAVAGNTYSQMRGQGSGCRLNGSKTGVCNNKPGPGTVGGQCTADEALLPPPCPYGAAFAACRATPGIGGICYDGSVGGSGGGGVVARVMCVTATRLLAGGSGLCAGYAHKCTIYG